jgi:hypothetical protein
MSDQRLEIVEQDEAGNITSTYIASGDSRVDIIVRVLNLAGRPTQAQEMLILPASEADEKLCAASSGCVSAFGISTERDRGLYTVCVPTYHKQACNGANTMQDTRYMCVKHHVRVKEI